MPGYAKEGDDQYEDNEAERGDELKVIKKAVRALLLFMLILCNIGAYAQKKMEYNIDLLQKV